MALEVQKLGRGSSETKVDMLIYGRSGAGKTYRAATAGDPDKVYVISPDPTGHKAIPYEVDGRVIRHTDEIGEVIKGFWEGGHGYEVFVVDGVSFIHDMMVKETGKYFHESMGAKDPDMMPLGGRMKILNRFRGMIRSLVDLTQIDPPENRVHVIFTTLEERLKEAEDAPFHIRPLFGTQKMNEQYPAFFSIISYIYPSGEEKSDGSVEPTRSMIFHERGGIMARDKLGIFPPALIQSSGELPDLKKFLNKEEV